MTPEVTVVDNKESRSYDALVDGVVVGTIIYESTPGRHVFKSTVVEPAMRGQGIGTVLVREALDDLRAQGSTLTNYCVFVTEFIDLHPEYADLLDPEHPGRPRR